MGLVQMGVVQTRVVQMGVVRFGEVHVQMGQVQIGVVQSGLVQMGVDRLLFVLLILQFNINYQTTNQIINRIMTGNTFLIKQTTADSIK